MAVTAAMRARLRLMVNELTTDTYSDDLLGSYIETYPLLDSDGNEPGDTGWVASYDLNAAAADIWENKAAAVWDKFSFTAVGEATYQRSTKYDNAMKQARYYRSKRAMRTTKVKVDPQPLNDTPWIANVNDPYE